MQISTPGVDHPETRTVLDVTVEGREDALVSFVVDADGEDLTVTVGQDRNGLRVRVPVGDRVDVVWQGPSGPRSLATEVVAVELGEDPVWRLRPVAAAQSAQRRNAVRTPVVLPVTLRTSGAEWGGTTVDLSEAGLRARWQVSRGATGVPGPESAGHVVGVDVALDDGDVLSCAGALVRVHAREETWFEASLRFIELSERDEDRVRARVFARLRELRRRGDL